ncbi:zinc finger protein 480-like isoform X2 [Anoplophora glabripennis]|nr:zinc finger protein 480-like isoform X2 [Anoplophora glabripennis]
MVGKTWEFNDRIQKAQSLLTDLVNNSSAILFPAEPVQPQTVLDTHLLSTPNEVPELSYFDSKPLIKCDFNIADADNDLSDTSEKSEHKRKTIRTKNKIRKYPKKKNIKLFESIDLDDTEFDLNDDGSIIPKNELLGWDTYPWTCCDCQVTFSLSDDLKEHYSTTHNSTSRYLCADCSKVYSKYSTFLAHVRVHRMKLRFCCDVCYRWFPTVAAQEQHRSRHGDDRPHACNTCGKRFRMQSALMVSNLAIYYIFHSYFFRIGM